MKHVINYDLPKSIDEYVHRIGRTGRVGNRGKATSFYDENRDGPLASNLVRILRQANQTIPDWLERAAAGGGGNYSSGRFGGRDVRGVSFMYISYDICMIKVKRTMFYTYLKCYSRFRMILDKLVTSRLELLRSLKKNGKLSVYIEVRYEL